MMTAAEIAEGDRLLEQARYALANYREFTRRHPEYAAAVAHTSQPGEVLR